MAVRPSSVRAGCELESEQRGILREGEVVRVQERRELPGGQVRGAGAVLPATAGAGVVQAGGAGARQLVARCAAELQLSSGAPGGGGPRRIVFAAASAEVREAYRKALLALGSAPRQQLRGAAAIVCPVDSRQ